MYSEENTFENIMSRALERVKDDTDKREGSVIYDALSPIAAELAQAYIIIDCVIDLVFPDTAVDEYLDRLVEQMGLKRNAATKAIRKAIFYNEEQNKMDVEIGTKFSIDELEYIVIERIKLGEYKIECTTPGTVGNGTLGILLPIDYNIKNLGLAEITDILIPGEDEETDEALRERYYEQANEKTFAGNIADYRKRTKEIEGVGAVKVIPVWAGGGTVKLIILDSNYNKASSVLIDKVQQEICPNKEPSGLGIAPIGHIVTVVTPNESIMKISSKIQCSEGATIQTVKPKITEELKKYFIELRKKWELSESTVVRISQIESIILNVEGVLDITQTTINGSALNIQLNKEQIPILGEVNVI